MKKRTTWRTIQSAVTLMVLLTVSTMTMAQSRAKLTDPSISNPNYDSEKLQKHHQTRARSNGADIDVVQEPKEISSKIEDGSLNKATSACFIPLDNSYTSIPRNDDGSFGPIALPFTFDLYGSSYNQVWINTNGNLTFNGPYSVYSASGFPFSQPMVAPFWGDVDTRNLAGGQIYYKLSATNLIVTWDNVGYYNQQADKLNEFQVVISDGVDPITGLGQNVCFNYGDMQWTTGSASSGVNGFGGTPATVGVNKGNNVDYYQLGRFNLNSSVYDGPGGNPDGINYLDQQCYCSQVSSAVNIAPIANNFPQDTITIACGDTYNIDFSFIPPEVNQTVTATVNVNGTCGTNFSTTSGSIANVNFSLVGQQCNEGVNVITFTATDNGTPVETTTVTLYVEVETCCNLSATATAQNESCANQADGSITVATSGGTAPISYSIDGGATFSSSSSFSGLATGTYIVIARDANGCESAPQTVTISGPTALQTASSATTIACNGGTATVTVTASGGTTPYTGTGTYTVSAGAYSFTVTDANGCTSTVTGMVSEPSALTASATATSIACNGGSSDVTVTAIGGTAPYTGTGTYSVSAGTYTYTVTDANGCSTDVTITVAEPTALSASATSTAILCNGGSSDITVTATGGTAPYTGTGTYSVSAGTYTYTVTDANGCSTDVTITVAEPTALSASATSTAILCNGGSSDV
ncbi:MAG: hypothetical protein HWE22_09575, partial [Flavobacteriales bacterium]|nr:hypothetical protein [Flavobacteriales bacterium]